MWWWPALMHCCHSSHPIALHSPLPSVDLWTSDLQQRFLLWSVKTCTHIIIITLSVCETEIQTLTDRRVTCVRLCECCTEEWDVRTRWNNTNLVVWLTSFWWISAGSHRFHFRLFCKLSDHRNIRSDRMCLKTNYFTLHFISFIFLIYFISFIFLWHTAEETDWSWCCAALMFFCSSCRSFWWTDSSRTRRFCSSNCLR